MVAIARMLWSRRRAASPHSSVEGAQAKLVSTAPAKASAKGASPPVSMMLPVPSMPTAPQRPMRKWTDFFRRYLVTRSR